MGRAWTSVLFPGNRSWKRGYEVRKKWIVAAKLDSYQLNSRFTKKIVLAGKKEIRHPQPQHIYVGKSEETRGVDFSKKGVYQDLSTSLQYLMIPWWGTWRLCWS